MDKTSEEKDPGGRPPFYTNSDELETKIIEFFKLCKDTEESPTITGLVLYCGFCDRASFYDYEKRDGFSHTIKKARTTMENVYETYLIKGNHTAGAIFALKNFGWADKTEVDQTVRYPTDIKINLVKPEEKS